MSPSEFRQIRKDDLGFTQAQIAQLMDVSKGTIYNIERKYQVPEVYALAIRHLVWRERAKPLLALL